jgi:hypothetical protein
MQMRAWLLALLALGLSPACTFFEGRTLVLVAVNGDAPDATSVKITVGTSSQVHHGVIPPAGQGEIKRGFYLPRGTGGTITVSASATDPDDCEVARFSRKVNADEGGTTYVSLVLKRTGQTCGGPVVTRDAGTPDARTTPDAGAPPDVPASADRAAIDTGPIGTPDAIGLGPSCRLLAESQCRRYAECLPSGFKWFLGTVGACEARLELECVLDRVQLPGSRITPAVIKQCADAFADPSYTCAMFRSLVNPAACLLKGDLPDAAPCGTHHQCQSGRCTAPQGGCGQCLPPAKPGDFCNVSEDCEQAEGATYLCFGRCIRLGGLNDACDVQVVFDPLPRICDFNHYCNGGRCVPLGRMDAPCTMGAQCDDGFDCVGQPAGRCRPVAVKEEGQACEPLDLCAGSGYCSPQKVCAGAVIETQPCDEMKGPTCLPPAECFDNVCTLPRPPMSCQEPMPMPPPPRLDASPH